MLETKIRSKIEKRSRGRSRAASIGALGVIQQRQRPELKKRILNWLIDASSTLVVIIAVSWAFEHLTSQEVLEDAVKFQTYLYVAVKALSPTSIFKYLNDSHEFLFFQIDDFLTRFFPLLIVSNITFVLWSLLWLFLIGVSPVLLPIAVLVKGNLFELILIIFVFVPLVILATRSTTESGWVLLGLVLAMAATSLIFLFLQLTMLAGLFIFGKLVSTAATWTATSVVGSQVYWCLAKRTEHSATERVLHFAKARLVHQS